jgi:hypothetical protein
MAMRYRPLSVKLPVAPPSPALTQVKKQISEPPKPKAPKLAQQKQTPLDRKMADRAAAVAQEKGAAEIKASQDRMALIETQSTEPAPDAAPAVSPGAAPEQVPIAAPKRPEGPTIYDIARQRAQAQSGAALQSQQDAMKRRFAAMGGINSGAALKANQLAAEESQRQLSNAQEGIAAQETAEERTIAQDVANKQFSRDERLSSQSFASRERAASQKFASKERLSQQEFTNFMATKDRNFQENQKSIDRALSSKQWGQQFQQALDQFEYDKYVNTQNLGMAQDAANKTGLLDMIFGGIL